MYKETGEGVHRNVKSSQVRESTDFSRCFSRMGWVVSGLKERAGEELRETETGAQ